ncbi:cohesin complex subunit [Tilletia horrida]|nr:cohesin complex subunit [Tilletia horrida]
MRRDAAAPAPGASSGATGGDLLSTCRPKRKAAEVATISFYGSAPDHGKKSRSASGASMFTKSSTQSSSSSPAQRTASRASKRVASATNVAESDSNGESEAEDTSMSRRPARRGTAAKRASATKFAPAKAPKKGAPRHQISSDEDNSEDSDNRDEDDEEEEEEEEEVEQVSTSRASKRSTKKPQPKRAAAKRPAPKSAAAKKRAVQQDASSEKEEGEDEDDFTSSSSEDVDNDDRADGDFVGAKKGKNAKSAAPRRSNPAKKATASAPAKKRAAAAPRAKGATKSRAVAGGAGRQVSAAKAVTRNKEDLPIKDDNVIFNSVKDSDTSLETAAEDWVAMYHDVKPSALAQLVTFLLRSAACNSDVTEDAVSDVDEIVSQLEEFQDDAKKESMPSYPIVSKAADFKKFRHSLSEFLGHLLSSAHEAESLFDDTFFDTFKTWIVAMSGSPLRPFRHTATLFGLYFISSLNDVLEQIRHALGAAVRQRDAEKKKARNDKARLREMEKRVQEQKDFEAIVKGHKEDLFSRDADQSIRCDCVSELGLWMKKFPDQYMSGTYFTYLGWVLSDAEPTVRLSAVQAMGALYGKGVLPAPLRHFTERFKGRLVDMAIGETDVSVRCATFSVLTALDHHTSVEDKEGDDLLQDEQREVLGVQLFDMEARVRKACAPFVSSILDRDVASELATLEHDRDDDDEDEDGEREDHADKAKTLFKSLAGILVKYDSLLNERLKAEQGGIDNDDLDTALPFSLNGNAARQTRVALAVKSLCDVKPELQNVEQLIELLSLDHSYADGEAPSLSGDEGALPPAGAHLKLSTQEETVLVEVLLALLRKRRDEADAAAEGAEDQQDAISRVVTEAMPRFFAKYKTDATRIAEILLVPQVIKLDVFLESNGMTEFAALWDNIVDQFVRHTESGLLKNAADTMRSLNAAKGFGETNSAKLGGLQDQLLASFRGAAQDLDVEQDVLTDRQVHAFSACVLRLKVLGTVFDNVQLMEQDEGGKLSTGWELALALASRGRVGRGREVESTMVQDALVALCWYIVWKAHQLRATVVSGGIQQPVLEALLEKRKVLITLMSELVGAAPAAEVSASVQRVAFEQLVRLHILFVPRNIPPTEDEEAAAKSQLAATLELVCDSDLQQRCAKFVEGEIWRFSFSLGQEQDAHDAKHGGASQDEDGHAGSSVRDHNSSDVDDDDESIAETRSGKKSKTSKRKGPVRKEAASPPPPFQPSRALLKRELEFGSVVAALVSALRLGIFDVKHSEMLLKHQGRLGQVFDACLKVLVDVLREAALKFGLAMEVCEMSLRALKQSFELYLADGKHSSESNFLALARAISSVLVLRGPHLTILRAVSSNALTQLHTNAITYVVQRTKDGVEEDLESVVKRAPGFFRALVYMLPSMTASDALKVKMEMDKAIREAGVDTEPKAWDAQRTYEKRVVGIIAKNQEARLAGTANPQAKKGKQRDADAAGEGNEENIPPPAPSSDALSREADADADGDTVLDEQVAEARGGARRRPRPRPLARPAKRTAADRSDKDDDDESDLDVGSPSPSARRSSAANTSAFGSGAGPLDVLADDEEENAGAGSPGSSQSEVSLGQVARKKRQRVA